MQTQAEVVTRGPSRARLFIVALTAVAVVPLSVACERALVVSNEGTVTAQISLPAAFARLPATAAETLRVTLEAPGATAQVPLALLDDGPTFGGTLEYELEEAATLDFQVRVEGALDLDSESVLLGEALLALDIEPLRRTAFEIGANDVATEGTGLRWDENRNGASNLDDLVRDIPCAPTAQRPPVQPSANGLQFSPSVARGTFERQVLVLDNTSDDDITLSLRVIGAPGLGMAPLSIAPDAERTAPQLSLGEDEPLQIAAQDELLVAVTFAPVDENLATGFIFIETTDRCGVTQAQSVRIIANSDGGARPAPASATGPNLDDIASTLEAGDAAGLTLPVVAPESLFVGAPITLENLTSPVALPLADGNTFSARAGAVVYVPGGGRAGVALLDAQTDVDLYAARIETGAESSSSRLGAIVVDSAFTEAHVSTDPESLRLGVAPEGTVWLIAVSDAALSTDQPATGDEVVSELYLLQFFADTAPRFSSVPSPAVGPVSGGTEVTLFGENFPQGASVTFAGAAATVLEVAADGSTIRCVSPEGDLRLGLNPATVVVKGPAAIDASSTATLPEAFVYSPAPPTVILVSPPTGARTTTTPVVVRGANFTERFGPILVSFGNAPGLNPRLVSATEIEVTAPVASAAAVVDVRVQVATPFGGPPESDSLQQGFAYVDPLGSPPSVDAITPASGPTTGGTAVTVTGSNFAPGVTVSFGAASAAGVTRVDETELSVVTPAQSQGGDVVVRVANTDGQVAAAAPLFSYFSVSVDEPSIFASTPDVVHAEVAGDTLTLLGQALTTRGLAGVEVLDDTETAYPASVLTAGPSVVQVRIDSRLPASATAFRARLRFDDDTSVQGPAFSAIAPTLFDVSALGGQAFEGEENLLLLSGTMLAPSQLVDVVLTSTTTGAEVVLVPEIATEFLVRVRADAGLLLQGEWDVSARYVGGFAAPSSNPLLVGGNCGNGIAESGEVCDGTDLGINTCISAGFISGTLTCTASCTLDTRLCDGCGDGIKTDDEACDGVDFDGLECVDVGPFTGGNLSCSPACTLDATTCTECGNGFIEDGEQCDTTQFGGQQCADFGFATGSLECRNDCLLDVSGCATCGDGVCGSTEDSTSCAADCLPTCHDGNDTCDAGETCTTCPGDCSLCAPYVAVKVSGDNQTAPFTGPLLEGLVVQVVDDNGDPVPNALLSAVAPAGTFASSTQATDASGSASFVVVLGREEGPQVVTVTGIGPDGNAIAGLPMDFTATADDMATGSVATIIGRQGTRGVLDEQGTGVFSMFSSISGLAFGPDETLYISDNLMDGVFALSPQGALTRIAGGDVAGPLGNGGPAVEAAMGTPAGLAVGPDGRLYVAELVRVRAIDLDTGIIEAVAGDGVLTGDGIPATAAALSDVVDLVFDSAGDLFLMRDRGSAKVLQIDAATGVMNTFLSEGAACDLDTSIFSTATNSRFASLSFDAVQGGMVMTARGTNTSTTACLDQEFDFIAASADGTFRGRNLQPIQTISGAAGTDAVGAMFYGAHNSNAIEDSIRRVDLTGDTIVVGRDDDVIAEFVAGVDSGVVEPGLLALSPRGDVVYRERVQALGHSVRLIRGVGRTTDYTFEVVAIGDGATTGVLTTPSVEVGARLSIEGVPQSGSGFVFTRGTGADVNPAFGDTLPDGRVLTSMYTGLLPGPYTFEGQATDRFGRPRGPAVTITLNAVNHAPATVHLLVNDGSGSVVLEDEAPFTRAIPNFRTSSSYVAVAPDGTYFFSSTDEHRVFSVGLDGIVRLVAGNGVNGDSVGGADALNESLSFPSGLAVDATGGLLIATSFSGRLYRVDLQTGALTHIGGNGTFSGDPNDGGTALNASLGNLGRIVVRGATTYFQDKTRCRVRSIVGGVVDTVVGDECNNNCNSGIVKFSRLRDFSVSTTGTIAVAGRILTGQLCDAHAANEILNVFEIVDTTTAPIALGGPDLAEPFSVAHDPTTGDVYFGSSHRILRAEAGGPPTPIMGDGVIGSSTVPIPASAAARTQSPQALTFSAAGDVAFIEDGNERIRRIVGPSAIP